MTGSFLIGRGLIRGLVRELVRGLVRVRVRGLEMVGSFLMNGGVVLAEIGAIIFTFMVVAIIVRKVKGGERAHTTGGSEETEVTTRGASNLIFPNGWQREHVVLGS
jgi:hypothetical protein